MEFSQIQRILANTVCEPQEDPTVESISHRELEDSILQLSDIREFQRLQTEEGENEESDHEGYLCFTRNVSRKRAFHEVFGQDSDSDSDSDPEEDDIEHAERRNEESCQESSLNQS